MHRRTTWLLVSLIFAWAICLGNVKAGADDIMPRARSSMRAREYGKAIKALDEALKKPGENTDDALYLRALANFYKKDYDAAIQDCDRLLNAIAMAENNWFRKARFLKAKALTEQRKFKEAERIYEEEANRLLSESRKQDIASVLVGFADALSRKPDPDDIGAPPPNYGKAYNLYKKALELEIGRDLRDKLLYKKARTIQLAGNHHRAISDFRQYLKEFDPDWTGRVGSLERMSGRKREKPVVRGQHVLEARYHLAEAQLNSGDMRSARVNLEDLLPRSRKAERHEGIRDLRADTRWLLVRAYRLPNVAQSELEKAVKKAREFLARHPRDPRAVVAAYWIARTYDNRGRADQAIKAYHNFRDGDRYALPGGDAATDKLEKFGKSPAELADEWQKYALYRIGQIRFGQKKYDEAREAWERYVAQYPNGPHWSACQRGIINGEFQVAVDAVAEKNYRGAERLFEAFLKKHPLDNRARQILFTLGQIEFSRAEKLEKNEGKREATEKAYRRAIERWRKLVTKYPRTQESSLALYKIGLTYEEKLGELEKALESYRRLKWGSWSSKARSRVAMMTQKRLHVVTERKFHTNETARVKLSTRNIEKLTVRQYSLDLEAYFRKSHSVRNIEQLDIDLIQPDKTWEAKIEGYADYKPLEQELEIPFQQNQPGVCIVKVSDEDLTATTLVIRSDIDIIVKSSRRQALVFAENRLQEKGAPGVRVLLSNGEKVFATGETGDDGVFLSQFKELENASDLRAFAVKNGHVASNALNLKGLGLSRGLSPKGYIYTDRPAYKPGQTVKVRGIIRNVQEGSYAVPEGETYIINVKDSKGRLLWEKPTDLSKFGTFLAEVPLDDRAAVGRYTITARRKKGESQTFSGHFQVQEFKLEKMRLVMESERDVYFRGEEIELKVKAEYYWGQPVSGKPVRYHLPDGRQYVEKTDGEGELTVRYDTSGLRPGRPLNFQASLEGENVQASYHAFLAREGFRISVQPSRDLVISGEPFDVKLKTTSPDNEPVGRKLHLFVLKRQTTKADPVLAQVPWIGVPSRPAKEVTVHEEDVRTDPSTGEATVQLTLNGGGRYIIRATGEDRFDQVITAEGELRISDKEDDTKLRFFAETDTLKVGQKTDIRLHSRVEAKLAVLTWEGEEILGHRIISLQKGYNPLALAVEHKHFPNFRVAVAVMDERKLRTAAKPFEVERELKVSVQPLQDVYAPGASGKVRVKITDQLGNPVVGEMSLALVDEALFAQYPDRTPSILDFFQKDARRHAEFRVASSCGFRYTGTARQVIKAYLEEADRLEFKAQEEKKLAELTQRMRKQKPGREMPTEEAEAAPAPGKGGILADEAILAEKEKVARNGRRETRNGEAQWGARTGGAGEGDVGKVPQPRRELPEAGRWFGSVVTDKNGEAIVEMEMPEKTTGWRLTARGCTVKTLVGEATGDVLTRKDFFVSLKAPQQLQEGDTVRFLARIHNMSDYEGKVDLNLTIFGGEGLDGKLAERKGSAEVRSQGGSEFVFQGVDVPLAAALKVRVSARAGNKSDALETVLPVRPWGLEFAAQDGGSTGGSTRARVTLPGDRKYGSRWMSISVGPSLKRAVIDMALQESPVPIPIGRGCCLPLPPVRQRFAGSDLLAAVSALRYAEKVKAPDVDIERLKERVRSLVSSLVVSQASDGGWSWQRTGRHTDWAVTSMNLWALSAAEKEGISVHSQTFSNAVKYLQNRFRSVSATDNDAKAVIVHALSTRGKAEFAHANRLHRERNSLSNPALAYTALLFVNLDRNEFASEMLNVLLKKAKKETKPREMLHWEGSGSYAWLNDEVETTAIAALALMRVRPESPEVKKAADYLMRRRGTYGFVPAKAHGPAVTALAAYFGEAQFAEADYRLSVEVNGKKLEVLQSKKTDGMVHLAVPREMLNEGENKVDFQMEGRGEYAYSVTLRGFSKNVKDPHSWNRPYVRHRYYRHARLQYRGRPIGASSSSPVRNIEVGQRVKVHIDIYDYHNNKNYFVVEENLPSGLMLVRDSVSGNFIHHEIHAGKIVMYYRPRNYVRDFSYELVGYSAGRYRVLPTVITDALHPGRMRVGKSTELRVLAPGEKSDDPYKMNRSERYALAKLYFDDGLYDEALPHLRNIFEYNMKHRGSYHEKEVARMLFWIFTSEGFYDAQQIVDTFEVLREKYPRLEIPFDKILVAGRAYRDIGEFERAYLIFKATIQASFVKDSNISAVLEDQGQFMGSVRYQKRLWREYPDSPQVVSSYFALAQALYEKAPKADQLAKQARQMADRRGEDGEEPEELDKLSMMEQSVDLLFDFISLYPQNPLADDAAFSISNALLDLKQYETVVELSERFNERYEDSELASGFQYMNALGHFWQHKYKKALAGAKVVARGKSKDRDFARYIVGQIYHALGNASDAIEWYRKVAGQYPDAKQAIEYFERKNVSIDEVNIFRPGEDVRLKLDYRNVKEAFCQVYRVDLMKLYLREKNLANITRINLAGIEPLVEKTIELGDGKDYADRERELDLAIKEEGAYLMICRGDNLFTSGMILVTPMKIEVQEDATSGRVRTNVRDMVEEKYVPEVHVKAIGSANKKFRSGETDLRGVFVADNVRGKATVIAREGELRYAFYRGEKWLGARQEERRPRKPVEKQQKSPDYSENLRAQQQAIQSKNVQKFDQMRRGKSEGVEVQKAF